MQLYNICPDIQSQTHSTLGRGQVKNLFSVVTFQNDTELIPTQDSAVKLLLVQRWGLNFAPNSSSQMFNKRPFLEQSERNL